MLYQNTHKRFKAALFVTEKTETTHKPIDNRVDTLWHIYQIAIRHTLLKINKLHYMQCVGVNG